MKTGDRVRCISAMGLSRALENGKEYRIAGVSDSGNVILDGVDGTWDPARFEYIGKLGVGATNPVSKPSHYQSSLGIQVIDIINEYFHDNYNLGNVVKYLLRADKKGSRQQDLEKALQYLKWEVERGQ